MEETEEAKRRREHLEGNVTDFILSVLAFPSLWTIREKAECNG